MLLAVAGLSAQQRMPPPGPVGSPVDPVVAERNLRTRVEPVYPDAARAGRVQGIVKVSVTIGVNGRPQRITVVGGPAMLREAALAAVRQWVYEPFVRDGRAVAVVTEVGVEFRLR
ncbi:MAG: hypothetical protein RL328_296 [Acidobacteriota bacterium]